MSSNNVSVTSTTIGSRNSSNNKETSTTNLSSSTSNISLSPLEQVCNYIENAKHILIIVGAGISTNTGIPDFRSPTTGLYSIIQQYKPSLMEYISEPQELFDIELFCNEPEIFYSICPLIYRYWNIAQPTITHHFLHALSTTTVSKSNIVPNISSSISSSIQSFNSSSRLLRVYTQNVDGLEIDAGLTKDILVQCHGTLKTANCLQCGNTVPIEILFPQMKKGLVPYCNNPQCFQQGKKRSSAKLLSSISNHQNNTLNKRKIKLDNNESDQYTTKNNKQGIMKPNVIFFHENLPIEYEQQISKDIKECDLLLIIGTSLGVKPISLIPTLIDSKIPKILINKEKLSSNIPITIELLGDADKVIYDIWKILENTISLPSLGTYPKTNKVNNVAINPNTKDTNTNDEEEWIIHDKSSTSLSSSTITTTRSGRNVKQRYTNLFME